MNARGSSGMSRTSPIRQSTSAAKTMVEYPVHTGTTAAAAPRNPMEASGLNVQTIARRPRHSPSRTPPTQTAVKIAQTVTICRS